jgi:hypothetical protein
MELREVAGRPEDVYAVVAGEGDRSLRLRRRRRHHQLFGRLSSGGDESLEAGRAIYLEKRAGTSEVTRCVCGTPRGPCAA